MLVLKVVFFAALVSVDSQRECAEEGSFIAVPVMYYTVNFELDESRYSI